ncbi:hypothetical protein E3O06_10160 [Cryobacterium glaciale]|uniref:Uncharacterized protein n=1 Tax=Cryobacterium glaciale TaxID=1259145 RepID=A0A4R8UWZ4_9MICO|nr:hypothetical protein [Cryobacterium glaciale]TFB72670.1 hypothetical protein E3O06_10160 [Cryobacterium glaciale]
MSDTATQSIHDFALAVRGALSDLPDDEIDDLTDGLEADLTEQAADVEAVDSAAPGFELGDPVAYAEELRSAAGLPVRRTSPTVRLPWLRRLRTRVGAVRAGAARRIRSSAAGAAVLDFLLVLRPLWWVLRGWVVYAVAEVFVGGAISTMPTNPVRALALAAFVVLSVQWGRGRWLPWRWLPGFRSVVSVCAVIVLPLMLIATANQARALASANANGNGDYDPYVSQGLIQNGQEVTNLFAYDADGQPLRDVQLFDQDGRALNVVNDPANTNYLAPINATDEQDVVVPSLLVPGGSGWNVFPLRQVSSTDIDYTVDVFGQAHQTDAAPAPFPFAQVQPLVQAPEAGGAVAHAVAHAGTGADSIRRTGSRTMTAGVFAVISPSAIDLPPTHSVDITDWVGAGDAED